MPRPDSRRPRAGSGRARSRSGSGGRARARHRPRRRAPPSRDGSPGRGRTATGHARAPRSARVELRVARRPGATVEVRERRAGATSRSRAGRAPRSGSCGRRPARARSAPTAAARAGTRLARDGGDVRGLVVERPAERVSHDEQARVRRPVPRPQSDRSAPERPADGRDKASPCVSRDVHRLTARLRLTGREDSWRERGAVRRDRG